MKLYRSMLVLALLLTGIVPAFAQSNTNTPPPAPMIQVSVSAVGMSDGVEVVFSDVMLTTGQKEVTPARAPAVARNNTLRLEVPHGGSAVSLKAMAEPVRVLSWGSSAGHRKVKELEVRYRIARPDGTTKKRVTLTVRPDKEGKYNFTVE